MELISIKSKITEVIKKYKYAALILLIGIVLMLIPGMPEKEQEQTITASENNIPSTDINEELEALLSNIDGVGNVKVMLTVLKGEQTYFQSNLDETRTDSSVTSNNDTVIISDNDKNEYGLVIRVDPAQYLGAVILCQGADSPTVRLAVIDAVSKITGLGTDRICVLKMK